MSRKRAGKLAARTTSTRAIRPLLVPLGALAAGFGIGGPAWSQSAPGVADAQDRQVVAASDSLQLPGVEVTGRRDRDADSVRATKTTVGKGNQEIRDIPQSVTVLTEKVIEDLKLTTLRDALHYTAGITFSSAEGGSDQDIRLRGFSLQTTGDILIDGMRDPSTYERDTFNYERIEVMRGSASLLFGRGSTGGVVNQVSKKPELMDQADFIGSVGNRGYWRTTIDVNTRLGETSAVRLNAMDTKANNDGSKVDRHGIAPSYRFGIGTQDDVTISAFYLNVNNIPPSSFRWVNSGPGTLGKVAPLDPETFYGTESDYQKAKASYGTLSWVHQFDAGGALKTQFRSGTYDRAQWFTVAGVGGTPNPNPALVNATNINDDTVLTRSAPTPRKDRYVNTYLQSDYTNTFSLLGFRNDVIGGIDLGKEQVKRYQNTTTNPLGARPNVTVGQADDGRILTTQPVWRDLSASENRAEGAYIQDLVSLTPWLKVLGGVRYDHFTGGTKNYRYATDGTYLDSTVVDLSNHPWSYRGGILFQPSTTASFHVSYGTSFNTSIDTYQFVNQQTANTPPEKSRNIEAGAKLDWLDDRLSTRFAVFRTEKYNERNVDADTGADAFLLSGKRHSDGVDMDIVGRITPQFEVYLSGSYVWSALIDKVGSVNPANTANSFTGQRTGLTPRLTGSLYANYAVTPKLRVGVGVRGSTKNYPLQNGTGAAQNTVVAPGYAVVDLLGEYKFTPDLFAQLNVTNLKNKTYADLLYQGFYVPGTPRLVQFSLGVRY